jgi:L-arabinokinase
LPPALQAATAHPIFENARVERFARLMVDANTVGADLVSAPAQDAGNLMYESHASYGACGLGSDGTDRLVELVREAGPSRGLFGARITGGGSGGTVAILGTIGAEGVVREIAARYAAETGRRIEVFTGSGPGAAQVGIQLL